MTQQAHYKTNNSFTKRPKATQIITYILFALETAVFYSTVRSNYISSLFNYVFTALYSLSLIFLIISTLICSYVDPSDRLMISCKNGQNIEDQTKQQESGNVYYCNECKGYSRRLSKHCRSCGRCAEQFDHHCIWINNCVGIQNYKSFFVMILSAFFNLSIYLVSVLCLTFQKAYEQYIGEFVLDWIVGGYCFIFSILLVNLIVFHIYLTVKGLSTIEYLSLQRQNSKRQRQAKWAKEQAQQKDRENKQYYMKTGGVQSYQIAIKINESVTNNQVE